MSNVAAMIMTFLEARRSSETRGIAPGNLSRGVVALAAALSVLGGAGWGADGPSDDGAADSVSGAQSPEGSGLDPEKAGWEVPRKRTPRAPEDDRPFPEVGQRQFGLGTAAMHLDFVHAREPVRLAGLSDYALAGLSFRAVYGKRVGYAAGLDLALGGGGAAGFALDTVLFPVGGAVMFGPTGGFGVRFGVGASGVTDRIPITLVLPAEARLEFDVWRRARFGLSAGVTWTPVSAERQGGTRMVPFADESFLAITARLGRTFPDFGASLGRGAFFRLERREQRGTALFGISIGYEVDMAR